VGAAGVIWRTFKPYTAPVVPQPARQWTGHEGSLVDGQSPPHTDPASDA
jgi:hypothetical protein